MSKKRSKKKMNRTLNNLENNSAMPITIASIAPRNPYANHPLMRKSTVHEKSKSAERSKIRRETKQLARGWSSPINIFCNIKLVQNSTTSKPSK